MDTLAYMLVIGFATWQTVEVWHHSEIARPLRNRTATLVGYYRQPWLGQLLGCPFCLSHWVAFIYALAWFIVPLNALGVPWIIAMAATRVAQLGNDLLADYCRTPRDESADDNDNAK